MLQPKRIARTIVLLTKVLVDRACLSLGEMAAASSKTGGPPSTIAMAVAATDIANMETVLATPLLHIAAQTV